MPNPRFLQLDVFTEKAGGGNPLGVVLDAHEWSGERMQAFAAWVNLVETTFVLPPSTPQASYRARIFTPSREIPFAGHPTVGTAHAVIELGVAEPRDGVLVQECGAGNLPVRVEHDARGRLLSVEAPRAKVLREGLDDFALWAVLDGVPLGRLPPAFVEGGRRWWLAELASEAALRAWQPDHTAIAMLARASGSLGLCAFARAPRGSEYDVVVRAFPSGVGIIEDPASGAANGLLAAYIAHREPGGPLARGYRVSQGREIGRDATLLIRIELDGAVWVGGHVQTVLGPGQVFW